MTTHADVPQTSRAPSDEALFVPDGSRLIPTVAAVGPWSPDALAGGSIGALLAREIERCAVGKLAHPLLARLTCDFIKQVPRAPLSAESRVVRSGRRLQLVEALVRHRDTVVVRAVGLNVGIGEAITPQGSKSRDAPPPPEDLVATRPLRGLDDPGFITRAFEQRHAVGHPTMSGPAAVWFRLLVPLVAGERTSPVCLMAMAADAGYGWSWVVPPEQYGVINADISLHLHRRPSGPWVCVSSRTTLGDGRGVADGHLFDSDGPVGFAAQTVVISSRVSLSPPGEATAGR